MIHCFSKVATGFHNFCDAPLRGVTVFSHVGVLMWAKGLTQPSILQLQTQQDNEITQERIYHSVDRGWNIRQGPEELFLHLRTVKINRRLEPNGQIKYKNYVKLNEWFYSTAFKFHLTPKQALLTKDYYVAEPRRPPSTCLYVHQL